jgi:predicted DCC family thiol-disulfide oxidoreductase YuxK
MLPNPSDRPKSDVVVYDGDCQFCRRQVERLNWLDRGKRLSFLTLQDPAIALLLPDLTHEQLMQEMVVVTTLWWLAPLLHIPGSLLLWSWAYRTIARNRYRWNKARGKDECSSGNCDLHFQSEKR